MNSAIQCNRGLLCEAIRNGKRHFYDRMMGLPYRSAWHVYPGVYPIGYGWEPIMSIDHLDVFPTLVQA